MILGDPLLARIKPKFRQYHCLTDLYVHSENRLSGYYERAVELNDGLSRIRTTWSQAFYGVNVYTEVYYPMFKIFMRYQPDDLR